MIPIDTPSYQCLLITGRNYQCWYNIMRLVSQANIKYHVYIYICIYNRVYIYISICIRFILIDIFADPSGLSTTINRWLTNYGY